MANGFRPVRLCEDLLDLAVKRANSLPIFGYSHRKFQANLVGCIGEVVFEKFLKHHGIPFRDAISSTEHDYVFGRLLTLDVKTKDRTAHPGPNFDNSVPLYNHEHQRPDYYFFISLFRDASFDADDPSRFKMAYLMGGISRETLETVAVRWEAGQVDPSNGTRFWTACLNVKMTDLMSNREMLELLRNA